MNWDTSFRKYVSIHMLQQNLVKRKGKGESFEKIMGGYGFFRKADV